MTNKTIGKYGEDLAKDFLIKNNFEILEMNYRYSKMSEIDIIAEKNNVLHFIEVKTRTQTFFGSPLEAVNQNKLKQIYTCSKFYLQNCKKHYKKIKDKKNYRPFPSVKTRIFDYLHYKHYPY